MRQRLVILPMVLIFRIASHGQPVTSVATTSPVTGGTITTTGTIACPTCVTSAAALTLYQLVIGQGSQAVATLGSLGTTTQVLHGNASGAPSFGSVVNADIAAGTIDLTAKVTGSLPIANGGTAGTTVTTALSSLGLAGVPYDIRRSGAVCNGTDQNTAVQAAITAGYVNIFIPAGCVWLVPSAVIPGGTNGITYIGENWLTSKIEPVPTSTAVTAASWTGGSATITAAGHGLVLGQSIVVAGIVPSGYNGTFALTGVSGNNLTYAVTNNPGAFVSGGTVSGWGAIQAQPLVVLRNMNLFHSINSQPVGFDCPIYEYLNLTAVTDTAITSTCYSGYHMALNGDSLFPGVGTSGTNFRNYGSGDTIFIGTYDTNGVGVRADLESGSGTEFLCDINGGSGGGQCFGAVENVVNNSSVPFTWFSTVRTSGNVIQFNHRASTFTGDVFYANMADISGTFSGNYLEFLKAGASMFKLDSTGTITSGGLNTTSPVATSGYVAAKSSGVTVANGANQNLSIGNASFILLTGATAAFSIGGLTGGTDGRQLKIFNLTGQVMTINNSDGGSSAANRIFIPKGSNYVCPNVYCVVDATYYSTTQWVLSNAN